MKLNIIFILLIYLSFAKQKKLKNGVYNIIANDLYLTSYKGNITLSDKFIINTLFRVRKISGYFKDTFYTIENIDSNNRLVYIKDKELIFDRINSTFDLWYIYKINNESFIFKNINNCYIIIINFHIFCNY